jgi:hypothetical protein
MSPSFTTALQPEKPTFRQQWEPILAEKNCRPLSPEEGAFLGKLSQVFHNLQQAGRVGSTDLARLGFATPEARRGTYQTAFEGWWGTPPRDPMELWQYVAYDIESAGLTLPAFLRPVTDTTSIRTRLTDRHRHEAVLRWTDRFDQLGTIAAAPAAAEESPTEWIDLRLCLGATKWTLESRASAETPWKTAPRMLLERFTREQAGLAAIDASPAVFAFLALCQSQWRFGFALQLSPDNVGSRQFLHRVLTHPVARRVVTGPNGAPLTLEPQPLRWHLTRSDADTRDFIVALHRADGTRLPAAALYLPGAPGYYLHEGVLHRGPPALDGQSVAGAIVPAEVIESPSTLQTLRRLGARLPEEIEARFVTIPLRARMRCTLDVDFAGQEVFLLQLLAVADTPPIERAWSPRGWQKDEGASVPKPAGTDGPQRIYSFDPTPATAAVDHLDSLGLGYNQHLARWTRRLTRTFPEDFLAWREALPPEIEVVATGELASLLEGPVRARVALELIETKVHRDWFDLALALKPEDTTLTHAEIALLLKARGKLVRLAGKGWRRLHVEIDAAPAAALAAAGFETASIAEAALAGERHRFHALQLAQTAVADLLPERQAEALRSRARAIIAPTPPELPAGLRAELRPYQREGFAFLAFLSANQLGGVLADDMGLGKTVQTLAWLLWLAEKLPAGEILRTLVVCPKSVVGNWVEEAAKFSPGIATVRYSPDTPDDPRATAGPHIIIANYTQLRLNAAYFTKQPWHAVILDEGQFIKTPSSRVAHVARDLPCQHRLILTGTPIENRLLDLWSLFAFALPGLLGTQAAFKRHYAMDNPMALSQLRTRVRHFLLRRTKSQVATDLPARTEEDIVVELEGEQAKLYQAELKRARAQLLRVETVRQLDRARFNILASLMRLRQICCHPALISAAHRDAPRPNSTNCSNASRNSATRATRCSCSASSSPCSNSSGKNSSRQTSNT